MNTPPTWQSFLLTALITEDGFECGDHRRKRFSGGKGRIYEFFTAGHTTKEEADFLKNEYGTGGRSHALSGSSGSDESHEARGERFRKANCAPVEMKWSAVAKRIEALIAQDRYLTPEEQERFKAEQAAKNASVTLSEPETVPVDKSIEEDISVAENGVVTPVCKQNRI